MKRFKLAFAICLILITIANLPLINSEAQANDAVYVTSVKWSHDGSQIAAVGIQSQGEKGFINIINTRDGQTIYKLEPSPGGFASVTWSPDDRFIAVGGYDQAIWIINIQEEQVVTTLYGHMATVITLDWSADGTRLVSGGATDRQVILWDMTTYEEIIRVETGDPWSVSFSPNDQQIAVGGLGGLRVFPASLQVGEGREQKQFTLSERYIGALAWSPDGTRIVFGTQAFTSKSAQIYIIDISSGSIVSDYAAQVETIFGIAWSPDNRLIATYSSDGFINTWEVQTGNLIDSFSGTSKYPEQLTFSPYGGQLAYGLTIDLIHQTRSNELEMSGVAVVVPDPSLERLEAISALCSPQLKTVVTARNFDGTDLPGFIAQVAEDESIPPACAADLIAVAEAIQDQ